MAKLLPNQLAICLFACLLTGGLLMQTGCVGALSQLIYTIRGHDEEPAFPELNDKRVAVVCVSDASAYGPDTLTPAKPSPKATLCSLAFLAAINGHSGILIGHLVSKGYPLIYPSNLDGNFLRRFCQQLV